MTDEKITQIQETSDIADSDLWVVVQNMGTTPVTRAKTGTKVKKYLNTYILPKGYLHGLTLSNNGSDATNDIDIAAGKCKDSTDAVEMILASALTKRLDASWAVGTNQGGLDTGSIANGTYHVWLIKRSDTGVVDALFSTSATSPTMPANYDYKRRIGSIVRVSAAIKAFTQNGDVFTWVTPPIDVNVTNPGTSAVTRTLTVPTGITVIARINALAGGGAAARLYLSALSQTDSIPTTATTSLIYATSAYSAGMFQVETNTSGQIRSRIAASDANTILEIGTDGWIDTRGRLA